MVKVKILSCQVSLQDYLDLHDLARQQDRVDVVARAAGHPARADK
jgi:hypothetical protein